MPPPEIGLASLMLSGGSLLAATVMLLVFLVALFIGSIFMPGRVLVLTDAESGNREFKLNGFSLFLLVVVAAALLQFFGWFSLAALQTHFAALFVMANVFSFAFSGWLYRRGEGAPNAPRGFWRGYFMGRELNPTLLGVDLKMFSYRPSLIGLALLNISFAVVQYETYGRLTLGMTLYQIFTFAYVFNYFQFEQGMIHTWDIISERFGWMLVWGDYALLPFFYCLAGWWLVDASGPELPLPAAVGIVALFVFGFWIFRGANEQKHRFKQDPNIKIWGKPAESLDGRLLVSGFWGIGRHLNYTGEICIYLSFALTTGFVSWAPFLVTVWLVGLLAQRSRRDERRCRAKYGELWDRYKRRARFVMVPYIY